MRLPRSITTAFGVAAREVDRLRRARRPAVRSLPGLAGRVEILSDEYGVSHIYADDAHDLFFAQGWVTARDRLFQLDVSRLIAAGRLCELVGRRPLDWRSLSVHVKGRTTLDLDVFLRTFGVARTAAASLPLHSDAARAVLEAYATGVTAAMESDAFAVEHLLLRRRPEPWSAVDSLTVLRAMAFELNVGWRALVFSMMLADAAVPEDAARVLWPHVPTSVAGAVRAPSAQVSEVATELAALREAGGLGYGNGPGLGSNAFAVTGRQTLSGAALLACDTHLLLQAPSPWHEVHLVGGGYDLHGFAVAGVPGIAVGRTPHHAWGLTAALVHDLDFFRERLGDGDERLYLTPEGLAPVASRDEVFNVRGEPAVSRAIRETRHGPLLESLTARVQPGERLALCWTGSVPGADLDALLGVWRASSLEAFDAALAAHVAPTFNVVYAGADGRVAQLLIGRLPRRRRGTPLRPLEGWTGEWDWDGAVPYAEHPRQLDPPDGFVVSANQRPVPDEWPYELGTVFEPPWRARRIRERLLALGDKVSLEDLLSVQLDVRSPWSLAVRDAALDLVGGKAALNPHGQALHQAGVELWATWDGEARADSAGAAVAIVAATLIGRELVRRLAGEDAAHAFVELGAFTSTSTLDALAQPARFTPLGVDVAEVVVDAFDRTMALCRTRMGDDPATWSWGRIHPLVVRHPLHGTALGPLFSLGPEPAGGGLDTVNRGEPHPLGSFEVRAGPALRFGVSARDRDQARSVIPGGQSGDRLSPHYDDQLPLFLEGQTKPAPVSRERLRVRQREIWHPRA